MEPTILLLQDEPGRETGLARELAARGFHVEPLRTACEAVCRTHDMRPELLVIDIRRPDGEAMFLARTLGMLPEVDVVVLTSVSCFDLECELSRDPRIRAILCPPCAAETVLETLASRTRRDPERTW